MHMQIDYSNVKELFLFFYYNKDKISLLRGH